LRGGPSRAGAKKAWKHSRGFLPFAATDRELYTDDVVSLDPNKMGNVDDFECGTSVYMTE